MGMSTLAWCRDVACKTAEEAIEKLYGGTHSIILYSSNNKKLDQEIEKVYAEIKSRNSKIEDINQQMLPTSPYMWDDIDGCLAVKCAEIGMDRFEKEASMLHLFSEPVYSCLTNPDERKSLNPKALSSLALLGSLVCGK